MNSIPLMGKFEGRIGLIPSSVFFYCLGFQIGVWQGKTYLKNASLLVRQYLNKGGNLEG